MSSVERADFWGLLLLGTLWHIMWLVTAHTTAGWLAFVFYALASGTYLIGTFVK